MISPSIHREIARQRQSDLLREAAQARRAAGAHRDRPEITLVSRMVSKMNAFLAGIAAFGRRGPQPAH